MKDKLNELLEALINGDSKTAQAALHQYLTSKTRSLLSEEDDYDGDDKDAEEESSDDDDSDDDSDEDEESEEEEEVKKGKGKRTDKAAKSRTKK